jgi:urea transport system ATP-binding protein
MSAVLEVRDLAVEFDGFRALDGVNLSVEQGELRFLIGPNGAGKTTLIDCITGLTRPTGGEILFQGQSLSGLREHQRARHGIGRSFQTPTVFESLTVIDNLDLAESFRRSFLRLFLRRREVTAGVSATLERIGLSHVAGRLAGTLSHGQKQWLEIGLLLVQQPSLLLLDEPVAGMSVQERIDTGDLLRELAGDHTVIVIEHDMAFLRRFAHKVTVLHEGRVVSEGTVEEVHADPIVREIYLGRSRDERSGGAGVVAAGAGAPGAGVGASGAGAGAGAGALKPAEAAGSPTQRARS